MRAQTWTAVAILVAAAAGISMQDAGAKSPRVITITSYNLKNLLDTQDNPSNPGDNTYLPKSQTWTPTQMALCEAQFGSGSSFYKQECLELDWSAEVLKAKLKNLAAVIGNSDNAGPDARIMQDVENLSTVKRLADILPKGAEIRHAHKHGAEPRPRHQYRAALKVPFWRRG